MLIVDLRTFDEVVRLLPQSLVAPTWSTIRQVGNVGMPAGLDCLITVALESGK